MGTNRVIEIPLKPITSTEQKILPSNFRETIENEYASKLLHGISVQPTKEKIEYLKSHLPIKRALVLPSWGRETLVIVPERANETDPAVIKEIYLGRNCEVVTTTSKPKTFYGEGVSSPRPIRKNSKKSGINSKPKQMNHVDMEKYVEFDFPFTGKLRISEACGSKFLDLMRPLAVNNQRIDLALQTFMEVCDLFVPSVHNDKKAADLYFIIERFISHPECKKLYGLMCHYLYWNIIHPFARKILLNIKTNLSSSVSNAEYQHLCELASNSQTEVSRLRYVMNYKEGGRNEEVTSANDQSDDEGIVDYENIQNTNASKFERHQHQQDADATTLNTLPSAFTLSSSSSLDGEERDLLYIQVENCFARLNKKMILNKRFTTVVQETLVAVTAFVMHDVLSTQYQWLSLSCLSVHTRHDQMLVRTHLQLKRYLLSCACVILDPAKVHINDLEKKIFLNEAFERFPDVCNVVNTSTPSMKPDPDIIRRNSNNCAKKLKQNKFYGTSVVLQTLFQEAKNPHTKKFLQMNSVAPSPFVGYGYTASNSDEDAASTFSSLPSCSYSFKSSGNDMSKLRKQLSTADTEKLIANYYPEEMSICSFANNNNNNNNSSKSYESNTKHIDNGNNSSMESFAALFYKNDITNRHNEANGGRVTTSSYEMKSNHASKIQEKELKKNFSDISLATKTSLMNLLVNRTKVKYNPSKISETNYPRPIEITTRESILRGKV